MKARDFDKKFDAGEDITKHLDMSRKRRPEQEQKRVNVDFPVWMILSLDKEARRLGVARQALIKMVIAEHIDKAHPEIS
ncbi:type II toxin-antitoxin system BrnA family antitoxin [Candidatus Hydrogenedentota bacterium]